MAHHLHRPQQSLEVPLADTDSFRLQAGTASLQIAGPLAAREMTGDAFNIPVVLDVDHYKRTRGQEGYRGIRPGDVGSAALIGSSPDAQYTLQNRFPSLLGKDGLSPYHVAVSIARGGAARIEHMSRDARTSVEVNGHAAGVRPADVKSLARVLASNPDGLSHYLREPGWSSAIAARDILYNDWYTQPSYDQEQGVHIGEASYQARLSPFLQRHQWFWAESGNVDDMPTDKHRWGRIYANVKSGDAATVFGDVVKTLDDWHVPAQAKVADTPRGVDCRVDGMVLWFPAEASHAVVGAVTDVQRRHANAFRRDTPALAAPLIGTDGKPLKGVAFAQNPPRDSHGNVISFGQRGCEWVVDALRSTGASTEASVARALANPALARKHGIDPNQPAFSTGGAAIFRDMRNYLA